MCFFDLDPDLIYLNHAAVSPWPTCTRDAVERFAQENARVGSHHYLDWIALEQDLREQLARLIHAPSGDDIALLKSTSEALSVVAYGLEWQAGDNVVFPLNEFPSNRIVWESLPEYVEKRAVDIYNGADPESALIAACDSHTRLLSSSSVQFDTGLRMDLQKLGEHCSSNGILFCVDAIQSIGALQFDAQKIRADFVCADAHKWMMAPEGIALFYSSQNAREQLSLKQYGWHMVEALGDFSRDSWEIADSARRFECGSPNTLGQHALHASLKMIEEVGMPRIESLVISNASYLANEIQLLNGVEMLTDRTETRASGIVTFRLTEAPSESLYQSLIERNIVCALRGGGIRVSPHFYTSTTTMDRFLHILKDHIPT